MRLNSTAHASMVFHIIEQGYHRPFVDGKANRDNIEDAIINGMYELQIPPVDQDDVDVLIHLVNELINNYGTVA
jgi:hypothetical protein